MIVPFCPRAEMVELIEFKTDTLRARAAEQRIRLTDTPRRIWVHQHAFRNTVYDRVRAMMRGGLPGPFWLPEWSQAVKISVAAGQTVIPVDTSIADYVAGGRVSFCKDDEGEVALIDSVAPDQIVLTVGPTQNWANARMAPAFSAYAPEGLRAEHPAGKHVEADIEWRIYDSPDIADDLEAPTYRGNPLLKQCAKVGAGSLAESTIRDVEAVDNGIARPFFDDTMSRAVQRLSAAWIPKKGAEVYQLRQWFYFLKGRQKAFWLPSQNNGIQLVGDVSMGAGSITIRSVGFAAGYGSGDLFIQRRDGSYATLQVSSAIDNGTTEALTLVGTAASAINVSDVSMACLMFRVTLDTDRIEFAYIAGYGARVVVPCVEVPL